MLIKILSFIRSDISASISLILFNLTVQNIYVELKYCANYVSVCTQFSCNGIKHFLSIPSLTVALYRPTQTDEHIKFDSQQNGEKSVSLTNDDLAAITPGDKVR